MNINLHTCEPILIDYLDGILSESENLEVELFLRENPEIAEQITDFKDFALPVEEFVYEQKEELKIVAQSDSDFEKWERKQPKLPQTLVAYPHKARLLKREIRRIPQWSWVAAAACSAVALWFFAPSFDPAETEIAPVAKEITVTSKISPKNIIPTKIKQEVDAKTQIAQNTPHTPHLTPRTSQPVTRNPQPEEKINQEEKSIQENKPVEIPLPVESLAMLTISDIELLEIPVWQEKPEYIAFEFTEERSEISKYSDQYREKLQALSEEYVINPLKIVIHNVSRRYHKRKTEAEMYIENSEILQIPIRYFTQR